MEVQEVKGKGTRFRIRRTTPDTMLLLVALRLQEKEGLLRFCVGDQGRRGTVACVSAQHMKLGCPAKDTTEACFADQTPF